MAPSPYAKTPERTMEDMTKIIMLVATFVIVLIMTISDSTMQTKVYTVATVTVFTTIVMGLYIGKNSIMDTNPDGLYRRIILYTLLCLTVVVPQIKYISVVSGKSNIIHVPAQLPYNGTIATMTISTMAGVIGGIYVASNNREKTQGILLKTLVGCTFLSGLSYTLVKITAERLDKMNANVLNELKSSVN